MLVQPCAWWGESHGGVGPSPWHFSPFLLPPGPGLSCLAQPGVCSGELAWKQSGAANPDGQLARREEQPGTLGIGLLHPRGVQVQGQGRVGVLRGALKQEAVAVTPLQASFPTPLPLRAARAACPSPPRAQDRSPGQTQLPAGGIIRRRTSFLVVELLG